MPPLEKAAGGAEPPDIVLPGIAEFGIGAFGAADRGMAAVGIEEGAVRDESGNAPPVAFEPPDDMPLPAGAVPATGTTPDGATGA